MQTQFIKACKNGDLDKAKRILKDNPTLNIHACSDFAFRLACGYGHLNIAQWLIDLSKDTETYGGPIDIHAFSDFAFRVACYHGHFDIARWLAECLSKALKSITPFAFSMSDAFQPLHFFPSTFDGFSMVFENGIIVLLVVVLIALELQEGRIMFLQKNDLK